MLISTPFILLAILGGPLLVAAGPAEPVVTFILDMMMKVNSRDGKPAEGRMLGYLDRVAGGNSRPDIMGWADAYKFRGKNLAKGYLMTGIVGRARFGIFKTINLPRLGERACLPGRAADAVGEDEVVVAIEEHKEVDLADGDEEEEVKVIVEEGREITPAIESAEKPEEEVVVVFEEPE
ncbi:hypothetical protein B0T25DRAFT_563252 [Lasiosphaeria hispida]|uniref:Uncharacterized protein n=1 Tax=Lasiosphaeria hispida TaxID=260671 RepID=A0AAJ0HWJ7_9PEZI|nr:hypothetical protein B0T25DRAFT_563252 [Lasiosphaeria hispida]